MDTTKAEQNKARAARLFEEMWNGHNQEAAADFYQPGDYVEGLKVFATNLFSAFPDWQMSLHALVAEGERVVVYWYGEGTHSGTFQGIQPTGRRIGVYGMDIQTHRDGRIVAEEGVIDWMGMMKQLGARLVTL